MQDLYARLGVEQDADKARIVEALRTKPELADRSAILLDAEKRAVYDRARATLKTVGELRRRLGLDRGESWFIRNYPDFARAAVAAGAGARTAAAAPPQAARPAGPAKASGSPESPLPARRTRLPLPALAGLAVVIAIIIAVLLFLARSAG